MECDNTVGHGDHPVMSWYSRISFIQEDDEVTQQGIIMAQIGMVMAQESIAITQQSSVLTQ